MKPRIIIAVPLIIEKIIRKAVLPKIQGTTVKMLLKVPLVRQKIKDKICEQLKTAFGGNFYEIIIGGAAFNHEIEMLLHDIGFNYTVGYGTTDTIKTKKQPKKHFETAGIVQATSVSWTKMATFSLKAEAKTCF